MFGRRQFIKALSFSAATVAASGELLSRCGGGINALEQPTDAQLSHLRDEIEKSPFVGNAVSDYVEVIPHALYDVLRIAPGVATPERYHYFANPVVTPRFDRFGEFSAASKAEPWCVSTLGDTNMFCGNRLPPPCQQLVERLLFIFNPGAAAADVERFAAGYYYELRLMHKVYARAPLVRGAVLRSSRRSSNAMAPAFRSALTDRAPRRRLIGGLRCTWRGRLSFTRCSNSRWSSAALRLRLPARSRFLLSWMAWGRSRYSEMGFKLKRRHGGRAGDVRKAQHPHLALMESIKRRQDRGEITGEQASIEFDNFLMANGDGALIYYSDTTRLTADWDPDVMIFPRPANDIQTERRPSNTGIYARGPRRGWFVTHPAGEQSSAAIEAITHFRPGAKGWIGVHPLDAAIHGLAPAPGVS